MLSSAALVVETSVGYPLSLRWRRSQHHRCPSLVLTLAVALAALVAEVAEATATRPLRRRCPSLVRVLTLVAADLVVV